MASEKSRFSKWGQLCCLCWSCFPQSKGNSSKLDKLNQIWGTCTSNLYRMVNLNFPYNCPIRVQRRVLTLFGLSGVMVGSYNASFKTFHSSSKLFVIHKALSHTRHPQEAKLSIIGVNQLKVTCGCSFTCSFHWCMKKTWLKQIIDSCTTLGRPIFQTKVDSNSWGVSIQNENINR